MGARVRSFLAQDLRNDECDKVTCSVFMPKREEETNT